MPSALYLDQESLKPSLGQDFSDVCTVKSRNKLLSLLRTGMITLLRRIPAVFVTCQIDSLRRYCPFIIKALPVRDRLWEVWEINDQHNYQMMEGAIVFHQYRKLKEEDLAATLKLLEAKWRTWAHSLTKEAKNPLPIRLGNASFLPYPGSIKKAPRFPEVVLVNATYRTNQYYMPDVNIIGVSNAGCQQHGRPDWCRSTWYIPPPDIPPILPNDLWHPSSSSPKTEDRNIEAVPETDDFGWYQEEGPFIHPKLPSCFGLIRNDSSTILASRAETHEKMLDLIEKHSGDLLNPSSKTVPVTEGDYLSKIWCPILNSLFNVNRINSYTIQRKSDTYGSTSEGMINGFKIDFRLIHDCKGAEYDIAAGELADIMTATKSKLARDEKTPERREGRS
ncbi:hypothetical protein VTP01DRAFT_5583 [Rhizomucor pusillus]|uniref:uncharacterized protein n=1 Tax=Rhizomucor pusillus TaxID=4840 RepID=UPI003743B473